MSRTPSRVPSAQAVSSTRQVAPQPSPAVVLPSSHASPSRGISTPSPHLPSLHTPVKHTLVGPQLVLSSNATCLQPTEGSQESVVHGLASSQFTAAGEHTPPEHTSGPVHALLSLHGALLAECPHPVAGLQLSEVQALASSQFSPVPALHTPLAQASPTVHTLPSASQAAPFRAANTHTPLEVLQLSVVQRLLSLHTVAGPDTHAPVWHLSPLVQALPSEQFAVLFTCLQPATESQLSLVQALPSSQLSVGPAVQSPVLQVSVVVHTLPSASQPLPSFRLTEAQLPFAGLHWFCAQNESPEGSQVFMVEGLTLHW